MCLSKTDLVANRIYGSLIAKGKTEAQAEYVALKVQRKINAARDRQLAEAECALQYGLEWPLEEVSLDGWARSLEVRPSRSHRTE